MRLTRHDPFLFLRPLLLLAALLTLSAAVLAADNAAADLVLMGAKVYPSPTAPPIENAVIVIRDGKIAEIGPDGRVKVPKGLPSIDCGGKVITGGFWNSHVHFTEPVWDAAETAPPAKLEPHMQEMLTKWGFTSVFDIGSNPYHTVPLRQRVDSRRDRGPENLHHCGRNPSRERHPGLCAERDCQPTEAV